MCSGTLPCREIATLRALTEAVQVRMTYVTGARDDLTAKATSLFAVARAVRDRLDRGGTLSRQMLSQLMREQFGESDASGIWSMRDAYDALETAQVLLALAPGSPLIDAGRNDVCPAMDPRGVIRPFDGDDNGSKICDIGAAEYGSIINQLFLPMIVK